MLPMAVNADLIVADFESGPPPGFFVYNGPGSGVGAGFPTVPAGSPAAKPGQVGDNTFLGTGFNTVASFGGVGQDFTPAPQDWSSFDGISFWMLGQGSGNSFQFEIFDNTNDMSANGAERFDTLFVDDTAGWSLISLLFEDFSRATDFQPGGAPDDGLTLTSMWGYAFVLDGAVGELGFDDITLFNKVPEAPTWALLGIGLLGLTGFTLLQRQRRRARAYTS